MKTCPCCNSAEQKRISRSFLFKLIPNSKFYKCFNCRTKYLTISVLEIKYVIQKSTLRHLEI